MQISTRHNKSLDRRPRSKSQMVPSGFGASPVNSVVRPTRDDRGESKCSRCGSKKRAEANQTAKERARSNNHMQRSVGSEFLNVASVPLPAPADVKR